MPALAEKLLGSGERLLIVAEDKATLQALDTSLWTTKADSFLPHSIAGIEDNDDAAEPVLLSTSAENPPNAAKSVLLADGQWRDYALNFDRTFFLFDASNIEAARGAWKMLGTHEGLERHYWKQDEAGRWREGP